MPYIVKFNLIRKSICNRCKEGLRYDTPFSFKVKNGLDKKEVYHALQRNLSSYPTNYYSNIFTEKEFCDTYPTQNTIIFKKMYAFTNKTTSQDSHQDSNEKLYGEERCYCYQAKTSLCIKNLSISPVK